MYTLPAILLLATAWIYGCHASTPEDTDWFAMGKKALEDKLKPPEPPKKAKNVILFIGDGMGISTVTAARFYRGELAKRSGAEQNLVFENFPHVALSKTYTQSHQIADSAASGTAMMTGQKTTNSLIGMSHHQELHDCKNMDDNKLTSIMRWSQLAGKATGIVSTARITHATPASTYAQVPYREYEGNMGDEHEKKLKEGCEDIASQLVTGQTGKDLNVALGGGMQYFLPMDSTEDSERKDNRDLIQEWKDIKSNTGKSYVFATNRSELMAVDTKNTDYLLGIFASSHLAYELDRDKSKEPSLAEMTETAIKTLQKDDDGFMLMVEGGRIDHAHHASLPKKALMDTFAFEDAVEKAVKMTSSDDTLIIVTADHSHTFTLGGGSTRANPILGITDDAVPPYYTTQDDKNMTTLSYANGPGGLMPGEDRSNPTNDVTGGDEYEFESMVPLLVETHGGEEVAVYASGPMSQLVEGVMEQHVIAHIMAYAACIGEYAADCSWSEPDPETKPPVCGTSFLQSSSVIVVLLLAVVGVFISDVAVV